ncbi:MAG: hypothetical protein HKN43_01715 [Rhodothermales bacterium]|nr:hypothetical protein [Rhodothermales bacterium]
MLGNKFAKVHSERVWQNTRNACQFTAVEMKSALEKASNIIQKQRENKPALIFSESVDKLRNICLIRSSMLVLAPVTCVLSEPPFAQLGLADRIEAGTSQPHMVTQFSDFEEPSVA